MQAEGGLWMATKDQLSGPLYELPSSKTQLSSLENRRVFSKSDLNVHESAAFGTQI
jgi:hypothetical protein